MLLGGGEVPAALVRRALEAGWPVVPTYGLSEAGSGVTALPTAEAASHPASAGRALPGVEAPQVEALVREWQQPPQDQLGGGQLAEPRPVQRCLDAMPGGAVQILLGGLEREP